MNTNYQLLSTTRINRLKAQRYFNYSDAEISAFGNRFAYTLCGAIVASGVATANIPIIGAMTIVVFLGVVLPYHPFDYIYNNVLRNLLQKPKLPRRSKQIKFACTIATLWLIATSSLFYVGFATAGFVIGGLLVSVAFLVITTDFCIPYTVYNLIFKVG